MAIASMTFTVTRANWEAAKIKIKEQYDINLVGDSGTTEYKNVTISYTFQDPQTLSLTILKHPVMEPNALIVSILNHAFKAFSGAA